MSRDLLAWPDDDDPGKQLKRLHPGLTVEHLHTAIREGEAQRRTATPDDPANAGGSMDYFRRVRTLRQVLREELGMKRYSLDGLPLVINEEKTLAFGVSQGDSGTGNRLRQPKTRRPVGEIKRLLVEQNQIQPGLFDLPVAPGEAKLSDEELAHLQTWFLLTYRYRMKGTVIVRSELSRAMKVNGSGYACLWKPRIFLPKLEFEGVIEYIEGTDDGPDEFDVPVEDQ